MQAPAAPVHLRRVATSDEAALDGLLGCLTPEDRYRRWFTGAADVHRAAHDAATLRPGDVGLLAVTAEGDVVGHGLLARYGDGCGDVAFEVDPRWRRRGIATTLLAALLKEARAAGLTTVTADVLCDNPDMLAVFREHGDFSDERTGAERHLALTLR